MFHPPVLSAVALSHGFICATARQRSTSKSQRDSAQRAATARQRSTGSPQRDSAQRAAHSATVCTLSHSVLQRDSAQWAPCATVRQCSTSKAQRDSAQRAIRATARQRDSATALNTASTHAKVPAARRVLVRRQPRPTLWHHWHAPRCGATPPRLPQGRSPPRGTLAGRRAGGRARGRARQCRRRGAMRPCDPPRQTRRQAGPARRGRNSEPPPLARPPYGWVWVWVSGWDVQDL
jgi:hypothetical protein